jgi:hypothetical protein
VALAAAAHFERRAEWVSLSAALDVYHVLSKRVGAFDDALKASQRRLSIPELPAAERADAWSNTVSTYWYLGSVEARTVLAALREDDPRSLDLDLVSDEWMEPVLWFMNEHGVQAPHTLIARVRASRFATANVVIRQVVIAEALVASDLARLALAIDEAEAHGLVVHAARMRVVLAQRSGDRTQLERARPVLERLGDRRSLRRLEEIAVALGEQGQQKPGKG